LQGNALTVFVTYSGSEMVHGIDAVMMEKTGTMA